MLNILLVAVSACAAWFVTDCVVADSLAEDPCEGCFAAAAAPPLQTGACTATFNVAEEPGDCTGKSPDCSWTPCKFVTQPLCDNSCCGTMFQDAGGAWHIVLCGQNTGIWLAPCQLIATAVTWRLVNLCVTPPGIDAGAIVYACSSCN